jgi:hypothetical protein
LGLKSFSDGDPAPTNDKAMATPNSKIEPIAARRLFVWLMMYSFCNPVVPQVQ